MVNGLCNKVFCNKDGDGEASTNAKLWVYCKLKDSLVDMEDDGRHQLKGAKECASIFEIDSRSVINTGEFFDSDHLLIRLKTQALAGLRL